jgi:hypothetical protein
VEGSRYLTDGKGRFSIHRQQIDYIESTGDVYEAVKEVRQR